MKRTTNFAQLMSENETWLIKRILFYAKRQDYTRYTSTLEEAWRLSIQGLSESLIKGMEMFADVPDFGPDDQFNGDPLTDFGVIEAQRHRARGISLPMFLGLMKYYKQAYIDLFEAHMDEIRDDFNCRLFIERSFDRIEIAFCTEWSQIETDPIIEELRTTAREMTNEKNAYLTAFESLADAVIMLDMKGKILWMNHAAASLADPNRVPGSQYHRLKKNTNEHPKENRPSWPSQPDIRNHLEETFPWLHNAVAGMDETSAPSHIIEAQIHGTPRAFELKHSQMLDVSEKFTARILTLRDITERRSIEAKLAQRNLEIEKLRHFENLGILSEGISHDFNNLLAVISSRTRAIKRGLPPGELELKSGFEHIQNAVEKMNRLTRTMRDCSGRNLGRASQQDLNQLVAQWYQKVTSQLPSLIQVSLEQAPNLPKVPLVSDRLSLILTNLLENAIESMGESGGSVLIRTGFGPDAPSEGYQSIYFDETEKEQCIYFEFTDSGDGIEEAILPNIFVPFFSTKFIGRGLGLSSVRGIVAAHGGSIRIKTTKGEGTRFQIFLPQYSQSHGEQPLINA